MTKPIDRESIKNYLDGVAMLSGCSMCPESRPDALAFYLPREQKLKPFKPRSIPTARLIASKCLILCSTCKPKAFAPAPGTLKTCMRCKLALPVEEFGANRYNIDGLQKECRPCRKVVNHEYYLRNVPSRKCQDCGVEKPETAFRIQKRRRSPLCEDCLLVHQGCPPRVDPVEARRTAKRHAATAAAGTRCMHCDTLGVDFYHPSRGNTGELLKATFDTMEEIDLRIAEMVALCGVCKTSIEREKIKTELFD